MKNPNENKAEGMKEKTKDFMEIVKRKAPIYWGVVRTKTTSTWNSGTKGKAICIGVAVTVLLLGCLVLGGKPKNEKMVETIAKSQVDTARIMAEAQAKADAARKQLEEQEAKRVAEREQRLAEEKKRDAEQCRKDEERIRQQVENERRQAEERKKSSEEEERQGTEAEEKAAEEKQDEEYAADSDLRAREILSGVSLWGQSIYFQPEKKVSYEEFVKTFYTIEDAFIPKFGVILVKLHSGQGIFPMGVSQMIVNELVPRADHLLFYCCRTGLKPDTSTKDKVSYVKLLSMAQMEKEVLSAYALAFGQDSKQLLDEAERMFDAFTKVRKSLPPHKPAADAEQRYAALPYPARPINLNEASNDVENEVSRYEQQILVFLPREKEETLERRKEKKVRIANAMKRSWEPVEIGSFPIKSFCGMKFGETRAETEKALGEPIWHNFGVWRDYGGDYSDYNYASGGGHSYLLKKPFRQFTRAVLHFAHDNEYASMADEKPPSQEFEALRSIRLEADIPGDVNYQSCLDELVKIKEILEEKYKIDLGKGQAGEEEEGKSYWYGVGLSEKGWIVLGIRTATDGNKKVTDGRKTMVLEVRYAGKREMEDIILEYKEKVKDKREADAEAQKKKLNVSKGEGADVL